MLKYSRTARRVDEYSLIDECQSIYRSRSKQRLS